MRIAVIYAAAGQEQQRQAPQKLAAWAKQLAQGMTEMGHQVDVLNARSDSAARLPGYDYVAILSEPLSFFSGKIPETLSTFLAGAGTVTGKKSAAFLKKAGLFSNKAMSTLMRAMEKEGMCVNWSEVLANATQAKEIAKRIGS